MLTVLQWFFWFEEWYDEETSKKSQCWLFCNGFSDTLFYKQDWYDKVSMLTVLQWFFW